MTVRFAKACARLVLGALASTLAVCGANALDWPTRSVSVVVPIAAGGNTDMMARIGAEGLAGEIRQAVCRRESLERGRRRRCVTGGACDPDGYTLLFAASTMTYLTPMLQKVDFDPDKDLTPITNIGTGAQLLGIRKSLPVTNLAELVAYAKANPGKLNCVVVTQR